jgi:hypothetical protein
MHDFIQKEAQFSDYVVYVDESGDHNLQIIDPGYPIFVLIFCIFHKRHYMKEIVPAFHAFKFKHFGHDLTVLHENEIREEKGDFRFSNRAHKNQFIDELSQIISEKNFIIISSIIQKNALKNKYNTPKNPYHIALGFCLERLYWLLQEKNQHSAKKTHILVENRGKKEDKELELEFRRICNGDNWLNQTLPFEIKFADKKTNSIGLQLADLIARPIGLNAMRPTQENKAFDVLKHKLYCKNGRENAGKQYEGYGMKRFP